MKNNIKEKNMGLDQIYGKKNPNKLNKDKKIKQKNIFLICNSRKKKDNFRNLIRLVLVYNH